MVTVLQGYDKPEKCTSEKGYLALLGKVSHLK